MKIDLKKYPCIQEFGYGYQCGVRTMKNLGLEVHRFTLMPYGAFALISLNHRYTSNAHQNLFKNLLKMYGYPLFLIDIPN
jgi:hypothetical protein